MSVVPARAKRLMGAGRVMALATSSRKGEPNVAPMQQCWWFDEETLVVGDFFMKKTMENILENGRASFTVWEQDPRECCKFTGSARYLTKGPVYDIKSGPTAGQLITE